MRTTLDIDDDVLRAAKELALRERSLRGAGRFSLAQTGFDRFPFHRPSGSYWCGWIPAVQQFNLAVGD